MSSRIDARGLLCPEPVIRLAQAIRTEDVGSTVTVWADDPAAEHDIPAWCRLRGHELAEFETSHQGMRFVVRKVESEPEG